MEKFQYKKKVYYHDTDAVGVAYYSRYLEWLEEARTEWVEKMYKPLTKISDEDDVNLVVTEVNIKYKSPAVFGDTIIIELSVKEIGKTRIYLYHDIMRIVNGEKIKVSEITMSLASVSVSNGIKPIRFPNELKEAINKWEREV